MNEEIGTSGPSGRGAGRVCIASSDGNKVAISRTFLALLLVFAASAAAAQTIEPKSGCRLSSDLAYQLAQDRDRGTALAEAQAKLPSIPYAALPGPYATPMLKAADVLAKVYAFTNRRLTPDALAVLVFVQCMPSPDANRPELPQLVARCQVTNEFYGGIQWCVSSALWNLPAGATPMPGIANSRATRLTED